jgi:hypothetical protein
VRGAFETAVVRNIGQKNPTKVSRIPPKLSSDVNAPKGDTRNAKFKVIYAPT